MVRKPNGRSRGEPSRVERRADARRLSILRAASRVFRHRGLAATGMRDIAAAADLSPGNLYYYFKGKHELLYFCQDRALDALLGALSAARVSRRPLPERLRQVIQTHVCCLLDEVEGSAAHLEVEALPAGLRRAIVAKRDRYELGLSDLVAAGVRRGEFAPCDARLLTRAMLGAINWTARWFRPDGERSASEVAGTLADFLVRGLEARGAASTRRAAARVGGRA